MNDKLITLLSRQVASTISKERKPLEQSGERQHQYGEFELQWLDGDSSMAAMVSTT